MIREELAELAAKPGSELKLLAALDNFAYDEASPDRLCWAAQCVWLATALKEKVAASEVRRHYEVLFLAADQHPELRRRIGCELMWNALPGGAEAMDPDASANASEAMRIAAEAEGIETQEEFTLWLNTHLQSDRAESGEAIRAAILEIVGDRWVFDRSRF